MRDLGKARTPADLGQRLRGGEEAVRGVGWGGLQCREVRSLTQTTNNDISLLLVSHLCAREGRLGEGGKGVPARLTRPPAAPGLPCPACRVPRQRQGRGARPRPHQQQGHRRSGSLRRPRPLPDKQDQRDKQRLHPRQRQQGGQPAQTPAERGQANSAPPYQSSLTGQPVCLEFISLEL